MSPHDQAESLILSDRIVVMKDGEIQQIGTPESIYDSPANTFVAGFVGSPPINLLKGVLEQKESPGGDCRVVGDGYACNVAQSMVERIEDPLGREVFLGVRAEDIGIESETNPGHGNTPVARASVVVREPMGSDLYLTVDVGGSNVKIRTRPDNRMDRGDVLNVFFDPGKIHLFDGGNGNALVTVEQSTE